MLDVTSLYSPDLPGELVDPEPLPKLALVSRTDMLKRMCSNHTYTEAMKKYGELIKASAKMYPDEAESLMALWQNLYDNNRLSIIWAALFEAESTARYTQWKQLYLDYHKQLREIMAHHNDASESARELLGELYLNQTQPGEPTDLDFDSYTDAYEQPDVYIKSPTSEDESEESLSYSGSFSGDLWDEDHEADTNDPDEMTTSAVINQNRYNEMRPTDELFDLTLALAYEMKKLREASNGIADNLESIPSVSARTQSFTESHSVTGAWSDAPTDLPTHHADWTYVQNEYFPVIIKGDEVIRDIVAKRLFATDEAQEFRSLLEYLAKDYLPEDVAAYVMKNEVEFLVRDIKLSNGFTIGEFLKIHGDAIVEFIEPDGAEANFEVDEDGVRPIIIDGDVDDVQLNNYIEDTKSQIVTLCTDVTVRDSPVFILTTLEAIENGQGVGDAINLGYKRWRMDKSPKGAEAFDKAKANGADDKAAMAVFYKAAYASGEMNHPRDKVVRVDGENIVLQTARSGYKEERVVTPNIARMKAQSNEMYVPKDAELSLKQKLMGIVQRFKWPSQLAASMKE